MSSGGIGVGALAIPVMAAAGAVVVVGGAALLVVRAAGAATEFLAAGVERLGEAMDQAAREQLDVQRSARLWEIAATEVVSLNAGIRLLSAAARRSGVAVDLPRPIDPACYLITQVRDWCDATAVGLRAARTTIDDAMARQERASMAGPTKPASADVLDRFQELLRQRYTPTPVQRPVPGPATPRVSVEDRIAVWLSKLDVDATAAERQTVLETASHATRQTDLGTAESYLGQLGDTVTVANAKVRRRRLAATWLVALEHPTVAAEPNPPIPDLVSRLQAVVDGEAELTRDLRGDAENGIRWANRVVERVFLRNTLHDILTTLGYRAESEMDVTHGAVRLVRSDWGASHYAELRAEDGTVTIRAVRRHGVAGGEAAALDTERCDDLLDDIAKATEVAQLRGIPVTGVTVSHLVERETAPSQVGESVRVATPTERHHR